MSSKTVFGEEAIALAAIESRVNLITGYPGSPGTGVIDHLCKMGNPDLFHIEWSVSEKIAAEVAIGASIAGRRAMVCVKNVGLNAMLDSLMVLNLCPVKGGMVFIIGDDPGGYGSQNDQDSRPIVHLLEMPWFEPADAQDAYKITRQAFKWSEQYQLPIFIRITRSFALLSQEIMTNPIDEKTVEKDFFLSKEQFVPNPRNAVAKHYQLRQRLQHFSSSIPHTIFNPCWNIEKDTIIIAVGHMFQKLIEVIPLEALRKQCAVWKLSSIYPFPEDEAFRNLSNKHKIIILEEHHSVIGLMVKAWLNHQKFSVKVSEFKHVGEHYRWMVRAFLETHFPFASFNPTFTKENELQEYPSKKNHCIDCRYNEVLDLLDEIAQKQDKEPTYIADPGCLFTVSDRLTAKMDMGGAVAVAEGVAHFMPEKLVVALFGDSAFFHSTIPAICNAVYQQSELLMVLLDNGSALTTGAQPHPASGIDIWGNRTNGIDMEAICRACGVDHTFRIDWNGNKDRKRKIFSEAIELKGLRLVVVKI